MSLIMRYFTLILILPFILTDCAGNKTKSILVQETGGVIQKDTIWSGNILIHQDVIIAKKATLTILPGTIVSVEKNSHTKVDPQYFSNEFSIIVRGALKAKGEKNKPIIFCSSKTNDNDIYNGSWGGIIFENNLKENILHYCNIFDAETGVNIINSYVKVSNCIFEKNIYAITVLLSNKNVELKNNVIHYNKYGIYSLFASQPIIESNLIEYNKEEGIYYNPDSFPLLYENTIKNNKYNIRFTSK
ncbi:right-handed parallel beta-helix repeat-containing protein [Candidatus Poribacteria bacterium]|nr:right-handed parallel beta-helix repeat-containing protein [Candidatus Poribacteria bacterium]